MTTTHRTITAMKQTTKALQYQMQAGRQGLEMATMNIQRKTQQKLSPAGLATLTVSLAALGLGLAGCGTGLSTSSNANTVSGATRGGITGNVHGGQSPIIGAAIQLYSVGASGLGSTASALIPSSFQTAGNASTDSNGSFNITGDYSCTKNAAGGTISDGQVYIVATGGTSQGTPGTNLNSGIALMAPLGDCASLVANASTTSLQINELTTVASVYALAQFMTGYANVGAATANNTGLINAVGNVNNLVNVTLGSTGGASLPAGATVPTTQLNTLADIIAGCINTSSASNSVCTTLFTAAGAALGTTVTDTVGATLAFAKYPTNATLLGLWTQPTAQSPFQPFASTQPSDWTIAINYKPSGSLSAPYGIAIDAAGNAWVTNASGSSVTELNVAVESTPSLETTAAGSVGTVLTTTGLLGPKGISIDKSNNIWVTNPTGSTVVKFVNATNTLPATYTVGTGPVSIANDSVGNAWVANQLSGTISEVLTTGTVSSFSSGLGLSGPTGIAIDSVTGASGGNVYIANSGGGNVVKLTNAGVLSSTLTDTALQGTASVAIDASNNVFALGSTTGTQLSASLSTFLAANSDSAASYSPESATSATGFYAGVAAVGTGQAVVTNTTTSGLSLGSLNTPVGVAVDPSGDVWTANSGDNSVSCFLGLVTPAKTPIAANVGP
jgi:hypothetical protein